MSETRNTRELRRLFDGISQDSARHARQKERQKRKRIDNELRRNVTVRRVKRREGEPSPHSEGGSSASTEESEKTLCGICFDNYRNIRTLRCGHKFCRTCIVTWATGRMANRRRCPTCRQSIHLMNKTNHKNHDPVLHKRD